VKPRIEGGDCAARDALSVRSREKIKEKYVNRGKPMTAFSCGHPLPEEPKPAIYFAAITTQLNGVLKNSDFGWRSVLTLP
jgi:hypothetical protein